jgi:5'-3' exonuclease
MTSDDSDIGDMFPTTFAIDTANKEMYWQCVPILPVLNIERVDQETSKINNNSPLNVQCDNFVFHT